MAEKDYKNLPLSELKKILKKEKKKLRKIKKE